MMKNLTIFFKNNFSINYISNKENRKVAHTYPSMGQINFSDLDNVFIVAELSANHNGNLDIAIETIRAAYTGV